MSWQTAALGDVNQEARSGFSSGSDLEDGIAQVRMNNLTREGKLDWSKVGGYKGLASEISQANRKSRNR